MENSLIYIPLAFALAFFLIEFLPVFVKNTLAIAGLAVYYYLNHNNYSDIGELFATIFLIGGIITLIAGYAYKGKRLVFFPFALMMFAGLIGLIEAKSTIEFFYAWELMTIGSYFLILRGKKSITHALSYILFSLGGAYLILAGFGIASIGKTDLTLAILSQVTEYAPIVFILLAIGFMTKTASIGLHIWLPGAHAEAEADVSPMVSAILLKAGVFGLIMLFMAMGEQFIGGLSIAYILSWVGVLTALMGNMMAAFQEDAKKLLAYSSIGALGYALFGLKLNVALRMAHCNFFFGNTLHV
jgi:formate hydrogenlyase subunit 3/multisubunit Na+/H+ antiporter MnhD subunit